MIQSEKIAVFPYKFDLNNGFIIRVPKAIISQFVCFFILKTMSSNF